MTTPKDEETLPLYQASHADNQSGGDWADMDIEQAYLRALEANDAVEWEIGQPVGDAQDVSEGIAEDGSEEVVDVDVAAESSTVSSARSEPPLSITLDDPLPTRVTPRQVIEAAIFVGGQPLTAKKLCYILKGDADLDYVEQMIDDLNHQYLDESRPYEIRLAEGGYRLVLHEEFQRLRNRVYGIGPREVRLSQDVLEVLALVAYQQPITPARIEELGKSNAGPLLRQLLRRELILLERDPQDRKLVRYRTTRRFLSVFGLGSLDELPQAEDLLFK